MENHFAVGLVVLSFLLILLGGVVHNTGSSLACPDWPTCHGSLMPPMKGGVAIEHSHRLLAASVGLLTIVLAALLYKRRKDLRGWGFLAVFLVVFQGVLGGITVIYRLPTVVSTAHLGMSFLFFAVVISIAWRTNPQAIDASLTFLPSLWLKAVTLLVYLQSVLGALVRHTGAGLICPDIPFCNGSAWPVDLHPIFRLHMAHRWMGVLVAVLIFGLAASLWKAVEGIRRTRFLLGSACLLVVFQIGLGLLTVITQKDLVPVTAHLGVAAMLWATMVLLWILTNERRKVYDPRFVPLPATSL